MYCANKNCKNAMDGGGIFCEKHTRIVDDFNDMSDFRDHWKERAEKAEAQLADVKPYIQHTPNCPVSVDHYALAPVCDCGLQAILEKS